MIDIEHNGQTVGLYASDAPSGMVDLFIREEVGGDWIAALTSHGIVEGLSEEGEVIPSVGVNLDVIGPVTLVPAVLSADGLTVITPAVVDTRVHVNVRLTGEALEAVHVASGLKRWQNFALTWLEQGAVAQANKTEDGKALAGITLIDPDSIATPARVWA